MPNCPHCGAYSMHDLGIRCPACGKDIQQMTAISHEEVYEYKDVGREFWLLWVFASTGGWFLGWFLGIFIGFLLGDIIHGVLGDILAMIMWGAVLGSVVSGIQRLVLWIYLRGQVSRAGWWVLAGTAGFALAYGGGVGSEVLGWLESVTDLLGRTVVGTLGGAVTGILQWLVLRGQVSRAGWWVLACTVGWGLSMAVAGAIEEQMFFVRSLSGGAVLGAVTGGALVWLLRQPVPEA